MRNDFDNHKRLQRSGHREDKASKPPSRVCGLDPSTGAWTRGSNVASSWGRRAITGETVKPRQIWTGPSGGRLPLFLDRSGKRLGIVRNRRTVSQVLGWLRAGKDHLALVMNGRQ